MYAQQYWCKAVSEVSHILTEFGCDLHDARGNVYGMGDKYREQDLRKILHFHIGIEDRFPVGGWHRWDVERGMEVGRVGARIIRIRNPVSVLSPALNGMSEESFRWVKPVACGYVWENLC